MSWWQRDEPTGSQTTSVQMSHSKALEGNGEHRQATRSWVDRIEYNRCPSRLFSDSGSGAAPHLTEIQFIRVTRHTGRRGHPRWGMSLQMGPRDSGRREDGSTHRHTRCSGIPTRLRGRNSVSEHPESFCGAHKLRYGAHSPTSATLEPDCTAVHKFS